MMIISKKKSTIGVELKNVHFFIRYFNNYNLIKTILCFTYNQKADKHIHIRIFC